MQILSTQMETSNDKTSHDKISDLDNMPAAANGEFSLAIANVEVATKSTKIQTFTEADDSDTEEDADSSDQIIDPAINTMINDINQLIAQIELTNKGNTNQENVDEDNQVANSEAITTFTAAEKVITTEVENIKDMEYAQNQQNTLNVQDKQDKQDQQDQKDQQDKQTKQDVQTTTTLTEELAKLDSQDKNTSFIEKMTKEQGAAPENTPLPQQFSNEINKINIMNHSSKELDKDQDNKYFSSLTQLGSLINSYTAQYARLSNDQVIPANTNASQSNYAEALRNAQQLEETHIQLLPQSLESHLRDTYNANIKLYPPELGHVLARLKIEKNNAELVITAENATVKGIIESNMPKLRESFQNANINLTNIQVEVSVNQEKEHKNGQNQQSQQNFVPKEQQGEVVKPKLSPNTSPQSLNSIIDAYI